MTPYIKTNRLPVLLVLISVMLIGCSKQLDQPELNNNFAGGTDFSKTNDMIFSLIGVYQAVSDRGWEQPLVVSTRGDDAVSYTHLRAHETDSYLVCRLLL